MRIARWSDDGAQIQCATVPLPGEGFTENRLVLEDPLGGSARLRGVGEDTKHRRTTPRQRGFRSSSPEHFPLDCRQAGNPPENGALEIVRETASLRAPTQSAELPECRGIGALCQLKAEPAVSIRRGNRDAAWRNHQNRAARDVRQGVDLLAASYSEGASAQQEKGHVRAQRCGNFDQHRGGDFAPEEARAANERCSGVAPAASESRAGGGGVLQRKLSSPANFAFAAKSVHGAISEVAPGRFALQCRVPANLELDSPAGIRAKGPNCVGGGGVIDGAGVGGSVLGAAQ